MSDFWLIVGDIYSTLFPELLSLLKKRGWGSTVLIWRQSEWSVLQSFWSNQWDTCPFLLVFFSITSSGMAVSPGRIRGQMVELGLWQCPTTEWGQGSVPHGTRTDTHSQGRAEHRESLSEALSSATREPVLNPLHFFPTLRSTLSVALKRPKPILVSSQDKSCLWVKSF